MRLLIKIMLVLLLLCGVLLAMVFSSRNGDIVAVDFFVATIQLPISLWLFLSLAIGGVLGVFASSGLLVRLLVQKNRTKRAERALQRGQVAKS